MSTAKQQLIQRFRASAIERLRRIALELHLRPGSTLESAQLESVLRELHTIKGESGMLGLRPVNAVVHRLEDLLTGEPTGHEKPTTETLLLVQRGLSQLVAALGEGELVGAGLHPKLTALQGELGLPETADRPDSAAAPSGRSLPGEGVAETAASGTSAPWQAALLDSAEPAPDPELRPKKTAARWVHVSGEHVDTLCDIAAELETTFRALYAQAKRTLTGPAPTPRELRALYEELESYRTQFDEVTSQVWALRLTPVEHVLSELAQHGHELASSQGKRVHIRVHSGSAQLERSVVDSLWEPLLHLLRNSIDHGIEAPHERGDKPPAGTLTLSAESQGATVLLTVRDDGRGIDPQKVRATAVTRGLMSQPAADALTDEELNRLLFRHGFSTRGAVTEVSGRGIGLDVVLSTIDAVGGSVNLTSTVGVGTTCKLTLPARLSHERALVFGYEDSLFAIPARQILDVFRLSEQTVRPVAGGLALWSRQGVLPLLSMAAALGLGEAAARDIPEPLAVVVSTSDERWAFSVASVLGEFDLLRKPGDALFNVCSGCVASATLDDGRLVLYLNLTLLIGRAKSSGRQSSSRPTAPQKRILLVDDSAIIRHLASLVLSGGGYLVSLSENGRQALTICEQQQPDLIISDLDMPEMDGLELLGRVRTRWPALPVIIFSNHASASYQQRARVLGANEYVVKADYDQEALLLAVDRILGQKRDG